jgi:hypothetical protein
VDSCRGRRPRRPHGRPARSGRGGRRSSAATDLLWRTPVSGSGGSPCATAHDVGAPSALRRCIHPAGPLPSLQHGRAVSWVRADHRHPTPHRAGIRLLYAGVGGRVLSQSREDARGARPPEHPHTRGSLCSVTTSRRPTHAVETGVSSYLVHESWLHMAVIQLAMLARQCLNRRMSGRATLTSHGSAWHGRRSTARRSSMGA